MDAGGLFLNAAIIFLLIIINGFFSGAEIAIITSRKGKIAELIAQGVTSAELVKGLKGDPDRFLATIQVGITLVGTLASAIGGAAAVEFIRPALDALPWEMAREFGETFALLIVVLVITYLTLIFGELVPKSLGLRYAEQLACLVARPVDALSRAASIFVRMLTASTSLVLRILGLKGLETTPFAVREEMIYLMEEGMEKGIIDKTERELIHGAIEFTDTTVRDVMVPRVKVEAVNVAMTPDEIMDLIEESGYSRLPVYDGDLNNIIGLLYNKDVLRVLKQKKPLEIKNLLRKPYFVPDTILVSRLLREMQKRRTHLAIVVNEHGETDGVVTIEDLVEEIVGEIEDEYDFAEKGPVEKNPDGSFLIDATISLRDLVDRDFPFEVEANEFESLAGFMMAKLQRIPRGGEAVSHLGWRLTVVDMEGRRIAKVKMERLSEKSQKKKTQ